MFKALLGIIITLAVGDAFWLNLRHSYHEDLFYSIQKSKLTVRWIPAILVYLIIVVSIYWGAIEPSTSFQSAVLRGAAIGAILYAFYDFTNYATITNYTLEMTLTDMLWGTVLCTTAAAVGYYFKK
jgi:uncharacterized membrane protein